MKINRRAYYSAVVRVAWQRFRDMVFVRIKWGIAVSTLALCVGLWTGAYVCSAVTSTAITVSGLILVGALCFLWFLVSAPAEIHAKQEEEISVLRDRCASFDSDQASLGDDLEFVWYPFMAEETRGHETATIMLRLLRDVVAPFYVSVKASEQIIDGNAFISCDGIMVGHFEYNPSISRCSFRFDEDVSLPSPKVIQISETPPSFIKRDALLSISIMSRERIQFKEIRIEHRPDPSSSTAVSLRSLSSPESSGSNG